ncbi:hypothetical protein PTTG_02732 [Puccinia triticina 1-1 BBBD Race 1]|uniref:Non-structural maintenance of chromosomes element 1 homolog n=2 Tax=Puccinia triticina TaxID=208348 RepID=A0A180GJS0_PUCT1|nr:uncharacterized protein PtA15_6A697 [Puccinia triticina]OAV92900.1 hypothetical protein PTTG_02732 [Puccinia triticina 1-1 BBBD Race 1]WAQ86067.1 hypothetical protein PtA15_6A697 [Puccinia triticina]
MSAEMTELHHLLIHAMLLRRVAPYEKWLEVWKKSAGILGTEVTDGAFISFYGEINERIERFGFRIDILSDEGLGPIDMDEIEQESSSTRRLKTKRWMAMVNTRSDGTAKFGTDFNPTEISLYKKMVDRIILSANYRYCISHHDCLRLTSTLKPVMKKSDAEKFLCVLVNRGWLSKSRTGCYSLSIRSKLELKSYIDENYNEEDRPPQCAACREIVMRGFKCPNSECPKAMHVMCIVNQTKQAHVCPSCKSPFNYNTMIGEDAPKGASRATVDEGDAENTSTQITIERNERRRSKRSRLQSTQELDEEDEDDG